MLGSANFSLVPRRLLSLHSETVISLACVSKGCDKGDCSKLTVNDKENLEKVSETVEELTSTTFYRQQQHLNSPPTRLGKFPGLYGEFGAIVAGTHLYAPILPVPRTGWPHRVELQSFGSGVRI